jgi:hypothetical protein
MERQEMVNLETILGLTEKLSAVEKLKLVERVLVDLESVVQSREPGSGSCYAAKARSGLSRR